jgi:hypothetical protein
MADEHKKEESDLDHIIGAVEDFWRYWTKKGKDKSGDWKKDMILWPFKYGWHNIAWIAAQSLLAIFIAFLLFRGVSFYQAICAVALWFIGKYLFETLTKK